MKNLIIASAVALTSLAGVASADVNSAGVAAQIHEYVPGADLSGVSDAKLIQALSVLKGSQGESDVYIAAQIKSVLNN